MKSENATMNDFKPQMPAEWQKELSGCRQRLSLLPREEIDRLADEAIAELEQQALEVHGAGR